MDEQTEDIPFCYSAEGFRRVLEQVQGGDAAYWGERRIFGRFIALEQRQEGTLMLRQATPNNTNIAGADVPERDDELYLVSGIADGVAEMLARVYRCQWARSS